MPSTSSYLNYLPAIFREGHFPGQLPFLAEFLLAFEQVLTGSSEFSSSPKTLQLPSQGLEDIIAKIDRLFNPLEMHDFIETISQLSDQSQENIETREREFLQWLADWMALTLRADWGPERQRTFLSHVIPLYRCRGTKKNLGDLLTLYTGLSPIIEEPEDTLFQLTPILKTNEDKELQVGDKLQLGVNSRIGSPPHFFRVTVNMVSPDQEILQRQYQTIRLLIDLQKPAHTDYDLEITFETMRVGGDPPTASPQRNKPIQVSVNTLFGDA